MRFHCWFQGPSHELTERTTKFEEKYTSPSTQPNHLHYHASINDSLNDRSTTIRKPYPLILSSAGSRKDDSAQSKHPCSTRSSAPLSLPHPGAARRRQQHPKRRQSTHE